jgi:hypothetical protein
MLHVPRFIAARVAAARPAVTRQCPLMAGNATSPVADEEQLSLRR